MKYSGSAILISVSSILLTCSAFAQMPAAKPKSLLDNAAGRDKTDTKAEAERIREARRLQARSLLFSLSSEARSFTDQKLRARTLARIADALWDTAAEQGQILFREAWGAAVKADQESNRSLNVSTGVVTLDEVKADQESNRNLDIRREVMALAAKHDRKLAEEFLQQLTSDQQENGAEISGNNSPPGNNVWELSDAGEKRLRVAQNLLSTGDVNQAIQFADPVLGNVTISTVDFLTQLREKDPLAADQRYAAMLANTRNNISSDANTVSVLSSYIFSPHTYVVFNSDGAADARWTRTPSPPAGVHPQLRSAFFQAASGVFLRPPPADRNQSALGFAGTYAALKRLMPLFEQYASPDVTEAMRGLFESLSTQVSDEVRQGEDELAQKGFDSEGTPADQERSLLDELEKAKASDESDQLYFRLAQLKLEGNDLRSFDYVSKINDSEFREQARAWVEWGLTLKAIEKKKAEVALGLARDGRLTHIQQVWVLTQSAKLLVKTDHNKALTLIEEARSQARLIDRKDSDRPRGLLAIANTLRLLDKSQMWAAISDASEAANWIQDFTGEGGAITQYLSSKSQIMKKTDAMPDFDIGMLFSGIANSDTDRAVQLAHSFKGEAPRANALIAIARSVLNERGAAVTEPQGGMKK
jgi:lactam utilization protein B